MTENKEPCADDETTSYTKKISFGDNLSFEEKKNRLLKQPFHHVAKGLDKWGGMPDPNYLFQLFSICVEYKNDKPGKLYGYVEIDGSGSENTFVSLFDYSPRYSKPISNKGLVPLSDPTSVSAATYIKIGSQLFVSVDADAEKQEVYQVLNTLSYWDMSEHGIRVFDSCCFMESNAKHGKSTMHYVISERAVEATIEISFVTTSDEVVGTNVAGKIDAYYGNFYYNCSRDELKYFRIKLFEADSVPPTANIPLQRSVMAVPYKSTLIIDSCFWDFDSREDIIDDLHEFTTQPKDTTTFRLKGNKGCYLDLKVHWKYDAPLAAERVL